ncbi:MAG: hypothetical protein JNK64_26470 [Myxococcales bacterium]|nr:hypothetical protein [Myxococcales bacterium]
MGSKLGLSALAVIVSAGIAGADIRPDPPPPPSKAPSAEPTSPPTATQGCGARRDMAPEWMFGLGLLGLGAWGLRRTPRRRAA